MSRTLFHFSRIVLICLFPVTGLFSQTRDFCNPDGSLKAKFNNASFLKKYKAYLTSLKNSRTNDNTEYVVPVVFRVVHDKDVPIGQDENLTDAELIRALGWLNDIFQGINCTVDGEPPGLNINIRFCLAKRDINGNTTSGITRYTSNLTDVKACCELEMMKNITKTGGSPIVDPFPDTNYISIWVVRRICPDCIPLCSISGLATSGGIVVASESLKTCQGAKVAAHEMGHFLGLPHTFFGGCKNDDCQLDGDGICDTPPVDDFSIDDYNCSNTGIGTKNSCHTDVNPADPNNPFTTDQLDLQNNFMDYSPSQCRNSFTDGQRTKMRFVLTNIYYRLLNSPGCKDTTAPEVVIDDRNYVFVPPPSCPLSFKATLMRGPDKACQGDTLEYYTYFTCGVPNEWKVLGKSRIISQTNKRIKVYISESGIDTIVINVKNVCASFTDTIFVSSEKVPDIIFTDPEFKLCPGESARFYAKSDSPDFYAQNNSSGTIYYAVNDTFYLPPHYSDSCYTLRSKYPGKDCSAKKPFCVKMLCSEELLVPNTFTPNADGLNDILKPIYYGNPGALQLISFRIYNRYGLLLFSTRNLNEGWNGNHKGKAVPNGAVVWILEYINHTGTKIQKKGSTILLR